MTTICIVLSGQAFVTAICIIRMGSVTTICIVLSGQAIVTAICIIRIGCCDNNLYCIIRTSYC